MKSAPDILSEPNSSRQSIPPIGEKLRLVLLPGFDGTGDLFAPFLGSLPSWIVPQVISYPVDEPFEYDELYSYVRSRLPDEPFVILGESFSGPLAIMIAASYPNAPEALLLVASFAATPVSKGISALLGLLARPALFSLAPPHVLLRRFLAGDDAPDDLITIVRNAIRSISPDVMAARARAVLKVDVRDALRACDRPILYLAGSRDRVVGRQAVRDITRIKPAATIELLDAPHFVLQRRPDEATQAIVRFLTASLP